MSKAEKPRKTKTEKRPTVRTKGANPAPTSNPGDGHLASTLSQNEIAARAYALFLARGGQPGDELRDWFQAEAELRQETEREESPPRN